MSSPFITPNSILWTNITEALFMPENSHLFMLKLTILWADFGPGELDRSKVTGQKPWEPNWDT